MSSIRDRALDAAVTLVGTEGIRALTHARVDAAAHLPPGSTSNHFRTRATLVAGVIEWIATAERADSGASEIRTREQLIVALVQMITVESGPRAVRTRARYALFLEADDESVAPLRAQRSGFDAWVRGTLTDLGGRDAARSTSFVMATAEGLLLHRITVDPDAPIEEVITRTVDAALG